MRRLLVAVAMVLAISTTAQAQPTAVLSGGYVFKDWLTVNNATVGIGAVDDNNTVYYIMEKQIAGLQAWLIFFDPAGTASVTGTITFNTAILALFTTSTDVNVTTAAYRLTPTVTYGNNVNTGLEVAQDAASFSNNVLSIDFTAADPGDHIRILTATAPEPSTWALLITGLGPLAIVARRRRKA